ncbi:hypothetical protein [Chryseobacterium vrystaatense]|uniref:MotA/TolQ/ExbB proton channel family protein n=1 Tax=Chryseobacterium vrystaatense TaxID=307480 RepID=A0ABR4UNN2_9FLAO|nr:hypothetical protein [Chryseobacterium vrystaatense]KFF26462.1 hypothetical protein IW16_11400 [Chryseobacterium vrystaatense]
MKQNVFLFILCTFINVLIANLALIIMATDLSLIYPVLISLGIFLICGAVFYRIHIHPGILGKWKLAGTATGVSLSVLLLACILTSVGTRMAMDGIIIAGLKGIIPLFVFAVIFASPFWVVSALFNFICLMFIKPKIN